MKTGQFTAPHSINTTSTKVMVFLVVVMLSSLIASPGRAADFRPGELCWYPHGTDVASSEHAYKVLRGATTDVDGSLMSSMRARNEIAMLGGGIDMGVGVIRTVALEATPPYFLITMDPTRGEKWYIHPSSCHPFPQHLWNFTTPVMQSINASRVHGSSLIDAGLRLPIYEGRGVAGIQLGDTEVDVVRKLGMPLKAMTDMRDYGEVTLAVYAGFDNDIALGLFFLKGRLKGAWLTRGSRRLPPAAVGKTKDGVGLGDPVDKIRAQYGPSTEAPDAIFQFCPWYRERGILFCPVEQFEGKVRVEGIMITEPGADVIALFKMWGPEIPK